MPSPVPPQRSVPGARRPLVVTADAGVLEEVLRLAAAAGVEADVAPDLGAAVGRWSGAPFVVVADDAARRATSQASRRLPRRDGVVLVGQDLDDADIWVRAVEVGAEHVVFLPGAESWLVARLADAGDPPALLAPVVAVVGGRGGAGATALASALAVTAARSGRRAMLVDADPLGGGLDLVFGGETDAAVRWPDLAGSRGRLSATALGGALPRMEGVAVLSCDRGDLLELPPEAVSAVLSAGRRGHDLVVVDTPRAPGDAGRAVLDAATTVLLVVPAEVRAAAAANRVAASVARFCGDVRLVVRGPATAGLDGPALGRALGLPLAGELRPEPGLDRWLERGEAPARRGRGPLFTLCTALLDELADPARAAA